jgi:hypothetical protein
VTTEDIPAHYYFSTACLHAKHQACRQTCKFCHEPCRCECHPDLAETVIRTRPVARLE